MAQPKVRADSAIEVGRDDEAPVPVPVPVGSARISDGTGSRRTAE